MGDRGITRNQFHVCSTKVSNLQRCLIIKKKKHDWLLLKCSTIGEKCDVTLPWQLNFWIESQQSFLTETAIFIFERWKTRLSYRFVPECNHALESHWSIFSFSLPSLQDHSLLRSRTFATIVTRLFYWYKI